MSGGKGSTRRERTGGLCCSRCSHSDDHGLTLVGEQLLCHPCVRRERRRAERDSKNVPADRGGAEHEEESST